VSELRYAPYPTDLIPAGAEDYDPSYDVATAVVEELDSYDQEERDLLFAAWCAELDAAEPPF
jgi:hypothetical protein